MQEHLADPWDVLVTSAHMEERRDLIKVLDGLSVNVISASSFGQAEEVLAKRPVALVFCDDDLPDGSYRELLHSPGSHRKAPRLVVTTRAGEWNDYLEAIRLGAFEVMRHPLRPTDVELTVLRAMHDEQRASYRMIA